MAPIEIPLISRQPVEFVYIFAFKRPATLQARGVSSKDDGATVVQFAAATSWDYPISNVLTLSSSSPLRPEALSDSAVSVHKPNWRQNRGHAFRI